MSESTLLRLPCSSFDSFSPFSFSGVVSFSLPNLLRNGLKNDECVELLTLIGGGRLLLIFRFASADGAGGVGADRGPGSRADDLASAGIGGTVAGGM